MQIAQKIPPSGLVAFACALLASICIAAAPPLAGDDMRYAPPEATFNAGNQLQLLQGEIDQQQLPAAAARIDGLLRDSGEMSMPQGDDGSTLSLSTWVQNLPAETQAHLKPACEAFVGAEAQQAVDEVQKKADADPGDFCRLARRYPLTHAAATALGAAAIRSVALGDVPAAKWMLDAATANGWSADPALKARIDSVGDSTSASMLPFEASWYQVKTRHAWAALRSFPASAGAIVFVAGPGQVMAFRENGTLIWKGPPSQEPTAGSGASATAGVTRAPAFSPAIFCDLVGIPQLLIIRQPAVHTDGWALRALRAEDGHLLWTTEGQDDFHNLVFGSNPTIVGRYVYAIAGDVSDQLDHLLLVAIDLTTGRQIWRCDIGTVSRIINPRPRNQPPIEIYRPWLNESGPAVNGDVAIATPNVGAVIAVGRFDGKLRWTHAYPTLPDPTTALQQQRDRAMQRPASVPPLLTDLSLRWANTPAIVGNVVVCAPQDSVSVLGVNVRDGTKLWESIELPTATLIGDNPDVAVLAGETLSGIDMSNGKVKWTNQTPLLGPCVIHGETIIAPTAKGLTALSIADGSAMSLPEKSPSFETTIAAQPARDTLLANDAAHCFGKPVK